MTSDPVLTAFVSVCVSVVTTTLALVVRDRFEVDSKIRRMMFGLCIECAGTVRAFRNELSDLKTGIQMMSKPNQSACSDLDLLRAFPCGFVVSPPLTLQKELVNLLPTDHARAVFLYFDCWERYTEFERRFRELFQAMLRDLAKAQSDKAAEAYYNFLREEHMEQLCGIAESLYREINKLMYHCCGILVASSLYLENSASNSVEALTDGQWKTLQAIRDDGKAFEAESSAKL